MDTPGGAAGGQEAARGHDGAAARQVWVGGRSVLLSGKALALFDYLYVNRNRTVTYRELYRRVWGGTFDPTVHKRNVHTLVSLVRRQIEPDPARPVYLQTARELGYVLRPGRGTEAPLIGRDAERAAVRALFARGERLVTLVGPPGVGKTRLAQQLAADLCPEVAPRAEVVRLSDARSAEDVAAGLARVLGVRQVPGQGPWDGVARRLREAPLLLVLDNLEQVVEAEDGAGTALNALVSACEGLRLLVTSRRPLDVSGEQQYVVGPLALPEPALLERLPHAAAVDEVEASPAVALYVRRAREADPAFRLTAANAVAVAEACQRLAGLPLALMLAAARPRADLSEAPDARSAALAPILERAIDWSYRLLAPAEQALFRRLAAFRGGCTLPDLAAVTGTRGRALVAQLSALVAHSLVQVEHVGQAGAGEARYSLLEPLHAFAALRLDRSVEGIAVRRRHAEHFCSVAESLAGGIATDTTGAALRRIDAEYENLREALWWAQRAGERTLGQALAAALSPYWGTRGLVNDAYLHLTAQLADDPGLPPAARERALAVALLARLARVRGEYERARELGEESLALCRALPDRELEAECRHNLGVVGLLTGELDEAERHLTAYQELASALGHPEHRARALCALGCVALHRHELDTAGRLLEQSLALCRAHWNRTDEAPILHAQGVVAYARGDFRAARTLLEEALSIRTGIGDELGKATSLVALARTSEAQEDAASARAYAEDALRLARMSGTRMRIADALDALAGIAQAEGRFTEAVRLWSGAAALFAQIGSAQPAWDRRRRDEGLAAARAALGEAAYAAAWREGEAVNRAEARAPGQPAVNGSDGASLNASR